MATRQQSGGLSDVPTPMAAAVGAAAYAVTYLLFYVVEGSSAVRRFERGFEAGAGMGLSEFGVDPPSTFQVTGWLFYASHNAGLEVAVSAGGQSQTMSANPGVAKTYLLIVPPVVLVAAGYLLASRVRRPGASLPLVGASVTIGYLVLSAVGAFLFEWSVTISGGFGQEATLTVGPDLITAVLVAGVVYPALFGGVGGYLASVTATDRRGAAPRAGGPRGGSPGGRGGSRQGDARREAPPRRDEPRDGGARQRQPPEGGDRRPPRDDQPPRRDRPPAEESDRDPRDER